MSSKTVTPPSDGIPPFVFEHPTLGHPAHLGELYDQRSGMFLGVQMYDNTTVENGFIDELDVKYSELSLSMSNSFEDKASVLDINAELSLEILGGLVSLKGSASYLKDYKSNTQSRAWAMNLKMRLKEKRLLFGEDELGSHVLPVVLKNYIESNRATHFVSSIVYGGSAVVNLVARTAKLSEDEKVEGALEGQLKKLKGVVDLKGKADVNIKNQFEKLNDKFDVVLYGDVDLPTVPKNPQDVLDIFPDLAELITKDGGVPVSVTLQPIPAKLRQDGAIIHLLDQKLLEDILTAFGNLDDVASRFGVLKDGAKEHIDHIPEFDSATRTADANFVAEHRKLLAMLSDFVSASKSGTTATSGTDLVTAAEELYKLQTTPQSGDYEAPKYPTNLAGLELAYSNFMGLVARLHIIGHTGTLSTIKDIVAATEKATTIPLFLMSPLTPNADDDLRTLSALIRIKVPRFATQDPPLVSLLLYVESPDTLAAHFPNSDEFTRLKGPALLVGKIDQVGHLTWTKDQGHLTARELLACELDLHVEQIGTKTVGRRVTALTKLNTTKSFSVVVWAQHDSTTPDKSTGGEYSEILRLSCGEDAKVVFRSAEYIHLHVGTVELSDKKTTRDHSHPFYVTFVQDATAKQWKLYIDDQKIDEKPIDGSTSLGQLSLVEEYSSDSSKDWCGDVNCVRVYSDALTDAQVAALSSVAVIRQ